ncbi:ABC transporter permease [Streptomyces shenzhenensis]|uniref:ABC transporter permease n=1 Tax=Streptomyces shenzhenensis TaxID=943815 RepID=UPI003D91BF98
MGGIGPRRAPGSTRRQVRAQFLTESTVVCPLGGVSGALLGALGTVGHTLARSRPADIPLEVLGLGAGAALVIGVLVGFEPAAHAPTFAPTEALVTP